MHRFGWVLWSTSLPSVVPTAWQFLLAQGRFLARISSYLLGGIEPMTATSTCSSSRESYPSGSDLPCEVSILSKVSHLADHPEIGDILRSFWCWNGATAFTGTCQYSIM